MSPLRLHCHCVLPKANSIFRESVYWILVRIWLITVSCQSCQPNLWQDYVCWGAFTENSGSFLTGQCYSELSNAG